MSSFHFCLSAAKKLTSFQLLPVSLMTDLLQLSLGLPLFLLPWGSHSRAAFDISTSSFLNVWPIHLNFLFLISRFISSWSFTLYKSLLQIMFDHHILKMYLRYRLTKICILRRISLVTSHVSHPFKSTDFTQVRIRFASWITKTTDTHSEYVILIAFTRQQWLRERTSMLRYMCIACLVWTYCNVPRLCFGKVRRRSYFLYIYVRFF